MHIAEGVLSGPVLLSGAALAAAGTAVGLKRLDYDRIPQAAVLSAAFFVASLVHVPVGPSSAHLILNGLVGLLLGWAAFPAILVALLLQGVLFQFGGITTLGVNTLIMALPAVICYGLFAPWVRPDRPARTAVPAAFACGGLAVFLASLVVGLALTATAESFFEIAAAVVVANLPVLVIEGFITAFCVAFLRKVQPGLLPGADANNA
jgi:cobalt/nickel transport system permease protein